MSLLNQRSYFSSSKRVLILETDPSTMDALEKIAIILGAKEDEYNHHNFVFDSDNIKKNEQSLDVIEMVYLKIPESSYITKINICHKNQNLVIEGDDEKFKALVALIQVFGKDIGNKVKVTFSDCEKCAFYSILSIAETLEILPV